MPSRVVVLSIDTGGSPDRVVGPPRIRSDDMPYEHEISRSHPSAFVFLVDQSGSMQGVMPSGRTKSQQVADVLNKTLATFDPALHHEGVKGPRPLRYRGHRLRGERRTQRVPGRTRVKDPEPHLSRRGDATSGRLPEQEDGR